MQVQCLKFIEFALLYKIKFLFVLVFTNAGAEQAQAQRLVHIESSEAPTAETRYRASSLRVLRRSGLSPHAN